MAKIKDFVYGMTATIITAVVQIITIAKSATTPQFLFLISSHSLIGVSQAKIFSIMPKEIAMEIAPVKAQPKVIRYCFKMNSIEFI